ncbi:MAG: RnfH family protein [Gammaproteobacteria bacterium]|nr:RnfH family protein [Gammaproteobacteria bacterium]
MALVEVVYVPQEEVVWHTSHAFHSGMTVQDALELSGIFLRYPEVLELPVGIFSSVVTKDSQLKPGDRVELYRPLLGNPKEKRRARAKKR